jgi:hypothetical protein
MPIGARKRRVSKDDRAKDVEVTLGLATAEAGIASRPYWKRRASTLDVTLGQDRSL